MSAGKNIVRNTKSYDSDLNPVLEQASNEDLQILHDIITDRDTEELTGHPAYKTFHPDHGRYADLIADEIREFGGNTFRNLLRGEGPEYFDVVRDVARKIGAPFSEEHSVDNVESSILSTVITKSLGEMPDKERHALLKGLGKPNLSVAGGLSAMAVQGLLRAGGFASYQLMVIAVNPIVKAAIGRGLALTANAALTRALSIAIGPVGWAATGLWTVISLGDPAYKITIPCVVYVAWLRASQNSVECEKCGVMLDDSFAFCPECGTRMSGGAAEDD